MSFFTLETDYSCETGYPCDDSRQIGNTSLFESGIALILNEQSAWLYPSISTDSLKTGLSVPDSLCTAAPFPHARKNRRRGVCGEGATVHRLVSDGWSISSSSVKTANNKIPVSSVFNDSDGLYGTTVCRCLVRRPHYSARLMRFGSRGPSEFFLRYATEMPSPRLRGKTPNRD